MALEFLHSEEDIQELIDFLYEKAYAVSRRSGPMRDAVLDREDAVHAMQTDLHTSWGTYAISTPSGKQILHLDSCGPQAHPSKLGRQGRLAGRIAFTNKKDTDAEQLMRLIRNYFRRNYSFQRYNGEAKMSCHFGPHYLKMEADFFADPQAEKICTGFLQLLCQPECAEKEAETAASLLARPDFRNVQISLRPHWAAHGLWEIHIPFLYCTEGFDVRMYENLVSQLAGSGVPVRTSTTNLLVHISNNAPVQSLLANPQAKNVDLLLQRPWIPFM